MGFGAQRFGSIQRHPNDDSDVSTMATLRRTVLSRPIVASCEAMRNFSENSPGTILLSVPTAAATTLQSMQSIRQGSLKFVKTNYFAIGKTPVPVYVNRSSSTLINRRFTWTVGNFPRLETSASLSSMGWTLQLSICCKV